MKDHKIFPMDGFLFCILFEQFYPDTQQQKKIKSTLNASSFFLSRIRNVVNLSIDKSMICIICILLKPNTQRLNIYKKYTAVKSEFCRYKQHQHVRRVD